MLTFRPLGPQDIQHCYEWANDPVVRENSHNSNPIEFSDHEKWFKTKLKDENSSFYIVEKDNEPVGQIRFDGKEEKVISYLLAASVRGQGYGTTVLVEGVKQLKQDKPEVKKIIGYVLEANIASNKAFQKAGFIQDHPDELHTGSNKYFIELKD